MPTADLSGVSLLLTRPKDQGHQLGQAIERRGGSVVRLPLIKIEGLVKSDGNRQNSVAGNIHNSYHKIIFISPNAVKYGLDYFPPGYSWSETQVFAIGRSTAAALNERGVNDVVIPSGSESSEELLESAALAHVDRQEVLIVRGEGGRELLAETLKQKGAQVKYLEVYRRSYPIEDPHVEISQWLKGTYPICLLTSVGAINALSLRCRHEDFQKVLNKPVIVLSPRMEQACEEKGWQSHIQMCSPADDKHLLSCISGITRHK